MNKYVLKVLGMRCGMCELHVEEAISKNIKVKKVKPLLNTGTAGDNR